MKIHARGVKPRRLYRATSTRGAAAQGVAYTSNVNHEPRSRRLGFASAVVRPTGRSETCPRDRSAARRRDREASIALEWGFLSTT